MNHTMPVIGQLLACLLVVPDQADYFGLLRKLVEERSTRVISYLNAHAVNLAYTNTEFRHAVTSSDLLLRDGIGVKIACWVNSLSPGLNMNGTDFIPALIAAFDGDPILLCGAEPDVVLAAAEALRQNHGANIVPINGFEPDSVYEQAIRTMKPALVILGLGMPKQEILSQKLKSVCVAEGIPCTIVNGGAIVDFLAKKVQRAPLWMRRAGLEWLFRLLMEPRRLARRYIIGNPVYLARIVAGRTGPHVRSGGHR